TLQFKPVTVFGCFQPVAHSKLTGRELLHKPDLLSCETLDTFAFDPKIVRPIKRPHLSAVHC
ncbi:hypothetical protein QZM22_27885, partial [Burkholderia oklahomensis]|uniref:hypothetical protein n=1 Tax=Burkholderia oklahomensis TaxID=342113 RepID=UPI002654B5DB